VSRVVHQLIESRGSDPITLLDLGCGAGRDVTFALVLAQRTSTRRWYATCVDRWRAALERAAQLLADYALLPPTSSTAVCDAIHAADLLDDGHVRELQAREASRPLPLDAWAASCLPRAEYDVVWLIRFWPRACLVTLPSIVAPRGLIVLSHFVHDPDPRIPRRGEPYLREYTSPPIDKRIQRGELRALLDHWDGMYGPHEILDECIERVEDGRPVHSLVLRVHLHRL